MRCLRQTRTNGFRFYTVSFRDRGRLGLEIEDPNNAEVGIEQPLMDTYRDIIHDDFFQPSMEVGAETALPATLRWVALRMLTESVYRFILTVIRYSVRHI